VFLLHEFYQRYSAVEYTPAGSIDEVSWLTAEASGDDPMSVPSGAALFVRGWATDLRCASPARTVIVQIDKLRTYEARVGRPRPDVAAALHNEALKDCGFETVIPTGSLSPGAHTISIAVVELGESSYANLDQHATFGIVADGVALPVLPWRAVACASALDAILDQSTQKALSVRDGIVVAAPGTPLLLRGWACPLTPREPFAEIYAVVDSRRVYRASAGLSRPDVAKDLDDQTLQPVGFEVHVPTIGLIRGSHEIEIAGLTVAGDALVRTQISVRLHIAGIVSSFS
jgi:hypothetical protein